MAHKIKKEWTTSEGYKAFVLFVSDSHHCGYVAVDNTHPWYKDDYDEHYDINIHGGLTFAGNIDDIAPESSNTWLFGFDAAHLGDKTKYSDYPGDTFKDVTYMENECNNLSLQLKEAEKDN